MKRLLRFLPILFLAAPLAHAGRPVDAPSYDLFLDKILYDDAFFAVSNLWVVIAAGLMFIMPPLASRRSKPASPAPSTRSTFSTKTSTLCASVSSPTRPLVFTPMFPGAFNGWWHPGGWFGVTSKDYFDLMTPRYDNLTWWADFLFSPWSPPRLRRLSPVRSASARSSCRFSSPRRCSPRLPIPSRAHGRAGKGWLFRQGFIDFAGTGVVHFSAGFAALACVLLLGPRLG